MTLSPAKVFKFLEDFGGRNGSLMFFPNPLSPDPKGQAGKGDPT